nr:MAG TPA: hypothetical protein [Bacteriophage sp.]
MEIRIYDAELNLQGIIENQTSLLWHRKYFEPGTFELHAPITKHNLATLKIGNLVTMHGQGDAGIIEDIQYEENADKNSITAQGRFLLAYMGYRLIRGTVNVNGTVEEVMRELYSGCHPIPLVRLGDAGGFQSTISGQIANVNLLKFMTKLARAGNLGFSFVPDFAKKTITFRIYAGKDRTLSQSTNNRVIFSESYDNLEQVTYRANDQAYANVAYVIGVGEDGNEVGVTVGDAESTGLERRETFVNARGVSASGLSPEELLEKLRQEGRNALNAMPIAKSFECDTNATGNFVYRKDYDLGDIVTIKKANWGMREDLRITEILETYEYGSMVVTPTFGNPLPTSIDWGDFS